VKVAFLPQTEEAAGLLRAYGPIRAVCDTYGWEAQLWPHKRQTGREFTLLNYMGPNRQQTVGMNPRQTYTIFQQEPPDTPLDMVLFHQPLGDHSWAIAELKKRDVTIVVDCDDDYLHIPPEYPTNEGLRAKAFNNSLAHLEHTIRNADLVTVSTPALADTYRRWNPNIVVIRNGLWWPMWENPQHVERDYLSIGYVGGLQYRRFDLTVLRGIVGPWLRRHPDWKFVSVGAEGEEVHDYLEVPEEQRVTVPWGEYGDGWAATVGLIDVGLVPLQRNRFNEAKCLDADTVVQTRHGLTRISQVNDGDVVWNGDQFVRVEAVSHEHARPGLMITTTRGLQVKVTPEHRLRVQDEDGGAIWRQAADIAIGDTLVISPYTTAGGGCRVLSLPFPSDGRVSANATKEDALAFAHAPEAPMLPLTERVCRLLGVFVGDGSVTATQVRIHCDGQDGDLIDLLIDDFRQIGLRPTTEAVKTWGAEVLRRRSVRVASAPLVRALAAAGVVDWRHTDGGVKNARATRVLAVPEVIFRAGPTQQAAFLAGLFEADGSVPAGSATVELSTKSRQLAADVQLLLLRFGIVASILPHEVKGGLYYKVKMGRYGLNAFHEQIGFLSDRKRRVLEGHATKPMRTARRTVYGETIASIMPCIVRPVDLQVDGERFVANGLESHNSHLKGMEHNAVGCPFVCSPSESYRWWLEGCLGYGLIAERPRDWIRSLDRLADGWGVDVPLEAREYAFMQSINERAHEWRNTWAQAIEARRKAA